MKMKTLIYSLLSISSLALLSSCGTIAGALTKGVRPVFLIDAPEDLVVSFDGKSKDITLEVFASTSNSYHSNLSNTTTTTNVNYLTSAVKLPYKNKGALQLNSAGASTNVELKPKGQRAIWWGNFLFFPITGHILDAVTDNNKTLFPRYIDVPAAMAGKPVKEWRSQGKMKRMEKKSIKRS